MKNVGQIQPAHKPAKDKINCPDQDSNPGPQMRWGGIHTTQQVGENNQIACEIVYFHDDSPSGLFKQKSELLSNNKLEQAKSRARRFSTIRVFCAGQRG